MVKLLNKNYSLKAVFLLFNLFIIPSTLADSTSQLDDLTSLDFDELMAADIQTTSAMKRLQSMSEAAASIYVLTNKEIIQSGVTSVAQALSLVPGMQVRKIDNNQWAITARGIAGRYSSKLLVMVDGQSIYNPTFAGVYWEALNLPLFDIERIEVIRGQGGLLWGSNATNGVVNIITKHSADTRDTVVQLASGSKIDHKADFRVGGDLANYSSFRIFGGVEKADKSTKSYETIAPNDHSQKKTIGGRVDLNLNDNLSFLAQADYTKIEIGQNMHQANLNSYTKDFESDEYSREHIQLMTRLEHRLSADSNQMLQVSISSQRGNQTNYKDDFLITDIDYQMNTLINNIQFDWGVNYRYNAIDVDDSDYVKSIDNINAYHHYGGFVQAQFTLIPETLKLIVGNRSEKNSFTGWGHQPMARLLWTPESKHTLWAAISQGVRIPSFAEYNERLLISSPYGIRTEAIGNSNIEGEKSVSKELGYRYSAKSWWVDLSLFHTKARNVLSVDPSINDTFSLISLDFVSGGELTTYGGEAVIKWQPYEKLSTELGYSFTSHNYHSSNGLIPALGDDTYLRQLIAKTNLLLTPAHSFSVIYRLESGDAYGTKDYGAFDLSWHWQVSSSVMLSFTGNNLLYGKHAELGSKGELFTISTYIEPSYLAQITAKF